MVSKDRLTKERERVAHVWASLQPEQKEMRAQSTRLNGLTQELEALRTESAVLEETCKRAGYFSDIGGEAGARAMWENAMSREGVLVQTCTVETQIKEALDTTERLLERERKRLHKELERVRMEKFWNLADGFRKRNPALSPVELLWIEEEDKLEADVLKVRDLRQMCWQRMHVDAQKLDDLREWERVRQDREEQRKERQERHNRRDKEREKDRQQQQQRGYHTDAGPRTRPHTERRAPYARPDLSSPPAPGLPKFVAGGRGLILEDAWKSYQARWSSMLAVKPLRLAFEDIPWPLHSGKGEPLIAALMTPTRIAAFILSPKHSATRPSMERIREAMKLWHPDKWEGRFMASVVVTDRVVVREALGMVARGLIELMRVQKKLGA